MEIPMSNIDSEREYIIGMCAYLYSGKAKNSEAITQELAAACATCKMHPEITTSLAELGDADCIKSYAEAHGQSVFSNLHNPHSPTSRNPISAIHVKDVDHFVRCLDVMKGAIEKGSTPTKSAAAILIKAKYYDCPELIDPSFDLLSIDYACVRERFFYHSHTFNMKPRFAKWMSDFMAREITPDQTNMENFGEHVDSLLRKGDPHGVAAYLRLGYDVRPGFDHGLINDKGNEWFNRFARRLQTSHDQIEMLARLPSLEEILLMDKTKLTHLIAGKSNKERRREAGIAKKLAQEAALKEGHAA
jgi:hypothetical protein